MADNSKSDLPPLPAQSVAPVPPIPIVPLPDTSAKIHPFVEFWQKEWRVIKTISFYVAVGIVAIAMYWFFERLYSGTISGLKEQVGAKDGTIQQKDAHIGAVQAERDLYKGVSDLQLNRSTNSLAESSSHPITAITKPVVASNGIHSQAAADLALLSPSSVSRIKAKFDESPRVPIRILVFKEDSDALELANQIKGIFISSGFQVQGVDKTFYKQPKGVTLMFKTKPTGKLWDSYMQICFELLSIPSTDMEDSLSDPDLWFFVSTK